MSFLLFSVDRRDFPATRVEKGRGKERLNRMAEAPAEDPRRALI
jgi:hypothetical protein